MKCYYQYNKNTNNQTKTFKQLKLICFLVLTSSWIIATEGCKKFIQVEPPKTQLVSSVVFSNDATGLSALSGVYARMMTTDGLAGGGTSSITVLSGLSSDELLNYSSSFGEFYNNSLTSINTRIRTLWSEAYQYIYTANSILEGINNSDNITPSTKKILEGEAKFIRAFNLLYLTNLFGDIPMHLTADYRISSVAKRSPQNEIYNQIISDLKDAQNLLPNDYSLFNNERVRPCKWAATALLARVYLYQNNWLNAEEQASSVINNSVLFNLPDLDNVFIKNSEEAIWQLLPVITGQNTREGSVFILTAAPREISLSENIIAAFEPGDNRRDKWVGSITISSKTYYYPYKYKIKTATSLTEYSMVLRLGEQYLIRAEARAHQNKLMGANSTESDLNIIRNRAGLPNITASTQEEMLNAINQERRIELFTEWGHRWFDLKRTEHANTVLAPIKGNNWQSTDILYPIPQLEIDNNHNISQNSGY